MTKTDIYRKYYIIIKIQMINNYNDTKLLISEYCPYHIYHAF